MCIRDSDVTTLNTGCCGMAGSFGYEKEHFDLSLKIGEDRLFPAIRNSANDQIDFTATGTSCRHQIAHGTNKIAYHPIELIWAGVNNSKELHP